jgi:hypothetical protein
MERASSGKKKPAAKADESKKPVKKEAKKPLSGELLDGAIGAKGTGTTPLNASPGKFDADAVKDTRNFLLAPTHEFYRKREWTSHRLLSEQDLVEQKVTPLLLRDATSHHRPIMAMTSGTTLTYVVYGNGYSYLDGGHILYELGANHGKALSLYIGASFCDVSPDKIDYQYRFITQRLMEIYGPSRVKLNTDPSTCVPGAVSASSDSITNIRLLVVDGLSQSIVATLKSQDLFSTLPVEVADCARFLQSLAHASRWKVGPRSADGEACAELLAAPAAPPSPARKRAAEPEAEGPAEPDKGQEADPPPRPKKRARSASASSDEDELSGSGSDEGSASESDSEESDENSDSETNDEVSSDDDDRPIQKRAEKMRAAPKPAKPAKPDNPSAIPTSMHMVALTAQAPAASAPAAPSPPSPPRHKKPGPKPKDPSEKKKPDNAGSLRKQVTDKLDLILKMRELFDGSLTEKLKGELNSCAHNLQTVAREYEHEGKVENARALIDAQSNLVRVLMKTLASVCRDNDGSGNTAHRKLAVVMATLYESESSQFESIAQTMVSMGAQMEAMVKKRAAAGEEAASAASDLAGLRK